MRRLFWISAILATPLLLAGQAMADFSYTTAIPNPPSPSSYTFSTPTTVVNFDPASNSGLLEKDGAITLVNFTEQTGGGHGYSGSTPLTIDLTITRGSFTYSLSVTGSLNVANGLGSFTATGGTYSQSAGGYTFTLVPSANNVTMPSGDTSQTNQGNLTMLLQVTAVPEPASVAMLGVGGLLLVAPRLRRLVRRIGQPAQA